MKWIDGPEIQVPYFTFHNMEKSGLAVCGFTTRLYKKDGVMDDFFQPVLCADSDPSEVAACDRLLLAQFGVSPDRRVRSGQEHTANVYKVGQMDLGSQEQRTPLKGIDGLITDIPGVMLQMFGADCPLVYLLDPVHRAIGLCHSGRKGTQCHIAGRMLVEMIREYATDPADVLAAISPGICADCYEVGDDVAEEFLADYNRKEGLPAGASSRDRSVPEENKACQAAAKYIQGRYHLDLNRAIADSLICTGVPSSHIELSDLCTRCRSDLFYSYRGQGCIINENSAFFMLQEPCAV